MKAIINILICLTLVSCATIRKSTLKETTDTTASVQNNIAKTTERQIVTTSTVAISDQSVISDTTVTNSITTKFSAPDSTGKQYATEQTKLTTKSWSKQQNNVKAQGSQTNKSHDRSALSDKSKSKSNSKATIEKASQIKVTTPAWVKLAVVVLVLVLLTGVYFALRRFGVIAWVIKLVSKIRG